MNTRNSLYSIPPRGLINRAFCGCVFLFLLEALFSGCDSYNLSLQEFFSGSGLERGATDTVPAAPPDTPDTPVTSNAFNNIAGIMAYLSDASNASKGLSATDPVPLTVSLDLASDWGNLLSVIQAAGKYVALDLSACTMPGTEFDPGAANTGEAKIVSLVLPGAATEIKGSAYPDPTFRFFTELGTVSGANIQSVGDLAFLGCTTLTGVSLPKATSIGEAAFYYCPALTGVSLPAATYIGGGAFRICTALTTVSLPAATYIGDVAFSDCSVLTGVSLPAATSIGDHAFMYCSALTGVSLPVAAYIGEYAFESCSALTGVSLPAATSIGEYAFRLCSALTTVSLPVAASIGDHAFSSCPALTTVSLPAATSIGDHAFSYTGDTGLTVSLGNTAPGLGTPMFGGVYVAKTVTVKVPSGATGYNSAWESAFNGGNPSITVIFDNS
jgi:hypothetical protein